jgi:hypothetical protein
MDIQKSLMNGGNIEMKVIESTPEMDKLREELYLGALPEASKLRTSSADQFPGDQLERALMDAEDLMARIQTPFFVVGEIAKQMVANERLTADGIDIAIRRNELTQDRLSTLKSLEPNIQVTEEGFSYTWDGVPIRIKIVEPENELFQRADRVWYNAWEYQIPNPFKEYLKTI